MFNCVIPGSENPADRDWMTATYVSGKIENGFKLGINDTRSLSKAITPFTVSLFRASLSHWNGMNSDYIFIVEIWIKNEEEYVPVNKLYYASHKPEMCDSLPNMDLFRYVDKPFKIVVKTSFYCPSFDDDI